MITKVCKKCNKELPIEDFTLVKRNKDGRSGSCKPCDNAVKAKNVTPEIQHQRYLKSREKILKSQKEYYEAIKKTSKYQEHMYNYTKSYRASRPGWMAAQCAKRRAKNLQATAKWDVELTEFISEEAHHLRGLRDAATNIKWNVDHIVPLQGKTFSGLHVWNNLQVIPKRFNVQKLNRNCDEYRWSDYFKESESCST